MKKINITIPTKNQLWGLKAWDVIKECGPQVAGTDLVNFLNGGNAEDRYNTKDGKLACSAWTSTAGSYGYVRCVGANGGMYNECPDSRTPAVRPVISNPKSILSNLTWEKQGDIYVTRYGEYPQDKVVDPQLSAELEETYHSGRLVATGKKYTFDSGLHTLSSYKFPPSCGLSSKPPISPSSTLPRSLRTIRTYVYRARERWKPSTEPIYRVLALIIPLRTVLESALNLVISK